MYTRRIRRAALVLACAMAATLLAGCGSRETQEPPVVEEPTVQEAYAVIIGAYYSVLSQGGDGAALMEQGLNYLAADAAEPMEDVGWGITDLDGDGQEELLIGFRQEDAFYGRLLYSLYTLGQDGAPVLLLDSTERNRYYYAGENRVANLGSCDWNDSFVTTLKLERGELVDMTYTTDPADYVLPELTPLSRWTAGETEVR